MFCNSIVILRKKLVDNSLLERVIERSTNKNIFNKSVDTTPLTEVGMAITGNDNNCIVNMIRWYT